MVNSVNGQSVTWDPQDMGGRGSKYTISYQIRLVAFIIFSLFGEWQDGVRRNSGSHHKLSIESKIDLQVRRNAFSPAQPCCIEKSN